jgi:hypothetical protein
LTWDFKTLFASSVETEPAKMSIKPNILKVQNRRVHNGPSNLGFLVRTGLINVISLTTWGANCSAAAEVEADRNCEQRSKNRPTDAV